MKIQIWCFFFAIVACIGSTMAFQSTQENIPNQITELHQCEDTNHNYKHAYTDHACAAPEQATLITQPDGSQLSIMVKGTRQKNYTETLDGYTIQPDQNGLYKYVMPLSKGNLMISDVLAHNIEDRTEEEITFLQQIPLHLRHSKEAWENLEKSKDIDEGDEAVSAFPTTGTNKVLVILIEYPDLNAVYTKSDFENMLTQPNYNGTGSFRDYYLDNSFGQLDLDVDVFGWYMAANPYLYYGNQHGTNRARELGAEAVEAANDAGVDFSQYDNDGDGYVDGVIFVHSGDGAETAGNNYIWSHRSTLWIYSVNYDGVTINDYMFNPEIRTQFDGSTPMINIGVFCHEFGHGLGLPDLYDYDNQDPNDPTDDHIESEGVGWWCIMGSGGYAGGEAKPVCMSAWSKATLGWITPTILTNSGSYSLLPADNNAQCYRINTVNSNEYFLLENQQNQGWNTYQRGHGLVIFHVDDLIAGNNNENHKEVDVEAADGLNHMDLDINRGDGGDSYPGTSGNTSFNDTSNPNSKLYDGQSSNICIENIVESGTTVNFDFGCTISCVVPTAQFYFNPYPADPTLQFVYNGTNADSYDWDFGDGNTSNTIYPVHTFTTNGNYNVCLTVTNNTCNDTDEICQVITINNVPDPCITPMASFTYNNAADPTISFSFNGTNADSYLWTFGDGASASNVPNPLHTYTTNGTYYVCVTTTNNTCGETDGYCQYIGVTGIGDACETQEILSGTQSISETYQVIDYIQSAQVITGNIEVNYDAGSYILMTNGFWAQAPSDLLAFIDGCDNLSATLTGESNEESLLTPYTQLKNYPNPFNHTTNIEFELTEDANISLVVFDATGKTVQELIKSEDKKVGKYTIEFEAQNLPTGTYFYAIRTDNHTQVNKMILVQYQ